MFGNPLGYALSPVARAIARVQETATSALSYLTPAGIVATSAYLYQQAFSQHYQTEADIYFAHARAAGAVLKVTAPIVFFPMLRMFDHIFRRYRLKGYNRQAAHKWLAISLLIFGVIHTAAHLLNNQYGQQEQYTGMAMLGIILGPLFGAYMFSSKLSRFMSYYVRFLLPHQLGWWALLLAFAAHTQDFRLAPIAATAFSTFSADRMVEWSLSFNTTIIQIQKIHENMVLLTLSVPDDYRAEPGSHVYIAYPAASYFFNVVHPFTVAKCEKGKLSLLITNNGPLTDKITHALGIGASLRITSAFSEGLSTSLEPLDDLMFVSSGSGLALTIACLSELNAKGRQPNTLAIYHITRHIEEIFFLMTFMEALNIKPTHTQYHLTASTTEPFQDSRIRTSRYDPTKDKYMEQFKGHLFFCGNKPIRQTLEQVASKDPDKHYHSESFGM